MSFEVDENLILFSSRFIEQKEYWEKKLGDEFPGMKFLEPVDEESTRHKKGEVEILIPPHLCRRIIKLGKDSDISIYIILLTALKLLICRYSGSEDIIVFSPLYLPAVSDETINHCVMIRDRIGRRSDMTFKELLLEVRQSTLEAYENQDYPFEKLTRHFLGNGGFSYIVCALENIHSEPPFKETPGTVNLLFRREGEQITGNILFNPVIYERYYLEQVSRHLTELVDISLTDINVKISQLSFLSSEEKEDLLLGFNDVREGAEERTIPDLFREQVEKNPDSIAAAGPGAGPGVSSITYGELSRSSGQLARMLRAKGVRPGSIAAIMLERSIDIIVGIFGILIAGGAYLPIDPEYPGDRKEFMLADSGAGILLTQQNLLPQRDSREPLTSLTHPCGPGAGDAAYLLYTSGTTGRPKGVMIEHRSVANLVFGLHERIYKQYQSHSPLNAALLSPFVFDASVKQIFGALLLGHHLWIVPEQTRIDAVALENYFRKYGIDISDGTPAHIRFLLESRGGINIKHFIVGGEALTGAVADRFFNCFNQDTPKITNVYGPTECCVDVTSFEVSREKPDRSDRIPIGKPLPNYRVYILSNERQLQPVGAVGEICVSGPGLARGYLNCPGLTAEKFVNNPFLKDEKLYCTGDLGRWLPDGNIDYLSRMDQQVKIRGFRIELEEIESLLLKHRSLKQAIVVVKEKQGEKYLCAYVIPEDGNDGAFADTASMASELKEYLSQKLPDYAIPTYFMPLKKIPLTVNGKLDRKSLPEPELAVGRNFLPPRNKREKKLQAIWSEVLKIDPEKISIDVNFFELGGHSLNATIMGAKVHKEFHIKIPLVEIFRRATISGLSEFIARGAKERQVPVVPAEKREYYSLSSAQKRMYLLQQMGEENTGYNMPQAMVVEGDIEIQRMEEVFSKLIRRHESLRTSFHLLGERPVQRIHPSINFSIENPGCFIKDFIRSFDLSQAPLLRVGLVKKEEQKFILMLDMHHIVTDGFSRQVLVHEFMSLFQGEELPVLRLQYKDYAQWQLGETQEEVFKRQEEYWLKQFAGEIPVLNLPLDYRRPAIQSFEGTVMNFELGPAQAEALDRMARENGMTLYMVLLGIYTVMLSKISGQEDIVVGTPIAARRHTDLERIIGMFVNTLVMRNHPKGEKTFKDFLEDIKARTLEAFENQEYPFEELVDRTGVKRDAGRNPLFDAVFTLAGLEGPAGDIPTSGIPGLNITPFENERKTAKFDLALFANEEGEKLVFAFEYCTKLFKRETIERFFDFFKRIVSGVLTDSETNISDIEIISGEEKKWILYDLNNTKTGYPKNKSIAGLFEEVVEKVPDNTAVILEDRHVTYCRLNERANRLARFLKAKGAAGTVVGLLARRSLEMMIGILGILKAGAGYLPIDPGYPEQRIKYMLADSGAGVLITTGITLDIQPLNLDVISLHWDEWEQDVPFSNLNMGNETSSSQLAYIIYTSGTTGKPKGTLTSHYNVVRVVKNTNYIELREKDRVLQLSNYAFDGSVFDIYGAILNGAVLVMMKSPVVSDTRQLSDLITREAVTVFFVTTALFNLLVDINIGCFDRIRKVLFGGERVSLEHSRKALEYLGRNRIIHVYGPTETTVYAAYYNIDAIDENSVTIPLGKPIANTTVYILDQGMKPVPAGIFGGVYIGGDGVARGYLNQPQLTAERFLNFKSQDVNKIYKTGDLARWLPDGNIEFLGRMDNQVKIRGQRVELEEIGHRLLNHPGIKDTAVVVKETRPAGDKYLAAYFVSHKNLSGTELREYLSGELPGYMIPTYFIPLEEMPLTVNGKIDRKALPEVEMGAGAGTYAAPRNREEELLVEIWSEVLKIEKERIGIDSDFFELGGHSLKASMLMANIHKKMNLKVPLAEIFKTPSIRGLSEYIKGAEKDRYLAIEAAEKKEYYETSHAQKRLWVLDRLGKDRFAYNIRHAYMFEELDRDVLERAFATLVRNHEILRTAFISVDGEPKQKIRDIESFEFSVDYIDLRGEENPELREQQIKKIANEEGMTPFNLEKGPLLRARLIHREDRRYVFLYTMHHIISDGWSMNVLINEILMLYNAYCRGKSNPLPPLRIHYKDFTLWHNRQLVGERLEKHRRYWMQKFSGDIPVLKLKTDSPRGKIKTSKGSQVQLELDSETAAELRRICKKNDAGLLMLLAAVLKTLFYRYTGQQDMVIGLPVAGRDHVELENQIGFYVNTLPLRTTFSGGETFENLLARVKETVLGAYEHQVYPFDRLVEDLGVGRDLSRTPLFDVVVQLLNFEGIGTPGSQNENKKENNETMSGVRIGGYNSGRNTSKFDLTFNFRESEAGLTASVIYSTDIFREERIVILVEKLKLLLQEIIAKPGHCLDDFDIELEVEKQIKESGDSLEFSFEI